MEYIVKYKLFLGRRYSLFWKKLRRVKGDGIMESGSHRFFILHDEARIEIPLAAMFRFCPKRWMASKNDMEREVGQAIPTKQ